MVLKILITHELFLPDISGGGEKLVFRLAKGLTENGHFVKVLTTGNPKIKEYDGIKTIRIPINRYLMNLTAPGILNYAKDSDIIQTSSGNACFPSWIASKLLKKPICCLICHIFGQYWRDVRKGVDGRAFEFMEKFFLTKDYDATVFLNESSRKLGMKMGIDKKRAFILRPGIDYKKFQLRNVKKEPFVLFVGNFSMNESTVKIKGLEYLIDAAKRFPDIKFKIIGSGEHVSYLRQTSPSNVVFMGNVTEKMLIELYNKALIFCLPSLTEGFGFTILEAMASGCAVVSTVDIGQTGINIEPKNTTDIVNKINYLINNPNMTKKMGKKNKKLAKNFTWNECIDGLIKIYNSIT